MPAYGRGETSRCPIPPSPALRTRGARLRDAGSALALSPPCPCPLPPPLSPFPSPLSPPPQAPRPSRSMTPSGRPSRATRSSAAWRASRAAGRRWRRCRTPASRPTRCLRPPTPVRSSREGLARAARPPVRPARRRPASGHAGGGQRGARALASLAVGGRPQCVAARPRKPTLPAQFPRAPPPACVTRPRHPAAAFQSMLGVKIPGVDVKSFMTNKAILQMVMVRESTLPSRAPARPAGARRGRGAAARRRRRGHARSGGGGGMRPSHASLPWRTHHPHPPTEPPPGYGPVAYQQDDQRPEAAVAPAGRRRHADGQEGRVRLLSRGKVEGERARERERERERESRGARRGPAAVRAGGGA
jgi:hypothetical protein